MPAAVDCWPLEACRQHGGRYSFPATSGGLASLRASDPGPPSSSTRRQQRLQSQARRQECASPWNPSASGPGPGRPPSSGRAPSLLDRGVTLVGPGALAVGGLPLSADTGDGCPKVPPASTADAAASCRQTRCWQGRPPPSAVRRTEGRGGGRATLTRRALWRAPTGRRARGEAAVDTVSHSVTPPRPADLWRLGKRCQARGWARSCRPYELLCSAMLVRLGEPHVL